MQGLTDMLQDGIIQMRVREKITFMVSALAFRYLKIYLCNVKINSCSLNMPFTLTVCVNINPTFISCEDITAPRKTRAKGWRKLRTNHFQENRLRESRDETTLQRAHSPFYQEATDQKDKRTGVCAESPDVPGCSDQRLGGFGGARLPMMGDRGPVGCRRWHLWCCPRTQSPPGISYLFPDLIQSCEFTHDFWVWPCRFHPKLDRTGAAKDPTSQIPSRCGFGRSQVGPNSHRFFKSLWYGELSRFLWCNVISTNYREQLPAE